jgi:hypothetical protein
MGNPGNITGFLCKKWHVVCCFASASLVDGLVFPAIPHTDRFCTHAAWAVRPYQTALYSCTVGGAPIPNGFVLTHRRRCAHTKPLCTHAAWAVRPYQTALCPCTVGGAPIQTRFVPLHRGRCARTKRLCTHAKNCAYAADYSKRGLECEQHFSFWQ